MLHYYYHHHYHQDVAATSAPSDLSSSESWSTCGGTGGSSYKNSSNKSVREQQQQSTVPSAEALERIIVRLASENAVVIFSNTTCCMCHAVKSLLCGMGVNPTVYELDQLVDPTFAKHIEKALLSLVANYQKPPSTNSAMVAPVPVVFVGGKLLGPMDRVMASHINGTLVLLLKQAGALWL